MQERPKAAIRCLAKIALQERPKAAILHQPEP